jgi:hypothetical protein
MAASGDSQALAELTGAALTGAARGVGRVATIVPTQDLGNLLRTSARVCAASLSSAAAAVALYRRAGAPGPALDLICAVLVDAILQKEYNSPTASALVTAAADVVASRDGVALAESDPAAESPVAMARVLASLVSFFRAADAVQADPAGWQRAVALADSTGLIPISSRGSPSVALEAVPSTLRPILAPMMLSLARALAVGVQRSVGAEREAAANRLQKLVVLSALADEGRLPGGSSVRSELLSLAQ